MNTASFLTSLNQRGVQLSVLGDELRITAPKGILTDTIRAELTVSKAHLIALLANPQTTFAALYAGSDEDIRLWLDERAAVYEFDANYSRALAEAKAVSDYFFTIARDKRKTILIFEKGKNMDEKLKDTLKDFLVSFESVFHYDWEFTSGRLKEDGYISPDGTFIRPQIDDESNNWGNRGGLLANYRRLLAEVKKVGIDPKKSIEEIP